jgi:hypothetical protein
MTTTTVKAPKLQVGQRVRIGKVRTRLMDYTGMAATVTEVHRMLAEIDESGTFKRNGLVSDERDCGKGALPCRWNGDVFEFDLPGMPNNGFCGYTIRQRFHHYSYSLKVDGLAHQVQVREKDILSA